MTGLPRTLVVFALRAESAGVFEAAGIPVLYCGVGKVNAAISLERELARYVLQGQAMPLVLNFGSAGSRCHNATIEIIVAACPSISEPASEFVSVSMYLGKAMNPSLFVPI